MNPFEAIPVKMEEISIISALLFSFVFVCGGIYHSWNHREHTRIKAYAQDGLIEINDKASLLFSKIDDTNDDLSEIKAHIAGMHEAVDWIKKYMEKKVS